MENKFGRPLLTPGEVEYFLSMLNYEFTNNDDIIYKIVQSEKLMDSMNFELQTVTNPTYRHGDYRDNKKRWNLRKHIVNELQFLKRLTSDDAITLGEGGALPNGDINTGNAYIVIGLPASGKSSISNKIADHYGCLLLDSDYAKRKLPEYIKYEFGASLVHKESDKIIFGFKDLEETNFKSLFEICLDNNYNIVIPKIGSNYKTIETFAEILIKKGYKVHLTVVILDRVKSTIRAIERYKQTNRYVPLTLIFDSYCHNYLLTYYLLRCKRSDLFTSFGEVSTDVAMGENPNCLDCINDNPAGIFRACLNFSRRKIDKM